MDSGASGRAEGADFLVIGAGIAGATAGYGLARHGRVVVLEQENVAGYHTTGRSAAFFAETYGGEAVRRLTTASKPFFIAPPEDFTAAPLVRERGALFIASESQLANLGALYAAKRAVLPSVAQVGSDFVRSVAPAVKADHAVAGLWDPECRDIDVHALHQGFLRGLRRSGGRLVTDARVVSLSWSRGRWIAETEAGECYSAPIIVNAAGAWGDEIACLAGVRPVGLIPKRRTVIVFADSAGPVPDGWPLVLDAEDRFYFKPETGKILASPGDATPVPPHDARPEIEDVAVAIDRLKAATRFEIRKLDAKWAGLRTFAPDEAPVVGEDPEAEGFYWFVGQGGYGMQTAPAMSRLLEDLVIRQRLSRDFAACGVDASLYAPARFMQRPRRRSG